MLALSFSQITFLYTALQLQYPLRDMGQQNLPKKPDVEKIIQIMVSILKRANIHGLSDEAIRFKVEEILFGDRKYWECAALGIITKEELANVLLSHLETLVENTCGNRFYESSRADEDNFSMQNALFGNQKKS